MSKKPKKFTVFGQEWTIKYVPKTYDCKGYTETPTQTIHIDESFNEGTQRYVLWHELHHVAFYAGHLNPPKKGWKYKHEEISHGIGNLEEYICSSLSQITLKILEENPKLRKFIFGE